VRESKRIYGVAGLAAALALSVFSAGAMTPSYTQNSNDNSNANGGGMGRNANGNMGGQSGMAGRGGMLGSTDRQFVMKAAMSDMAEIELGRLAVAQGASDSVKQFGQRMVDDHTRTSQQLMQIVSTAGVTPPSALDPKHRAVVAKMSRLSGAEFDRAYAKQMVKNHQEAVSLFQRESARGTHSELKAFAAATLPALQEHLSMSRAMAGGHGSMSHGGNSNSNSGGAANSNRNSNN
jgi:putative membrane protein